MNRLQGALQTVELTKPIAGKLGKVNDIFEFALKAKDVLGNVCVVFACLY